MSKNNGVRVALTAFAAVFALTTTTVDAEAKPRPKTTKASASDKRPDASRQRGQTSRGGTTAGSATRDTRRPDTSRNRAGYLNPPTARAPRQVTFRLPSKSQRTAASTLRREARRGIVPLSSTTRDRRAPQATAALASKQAARGKPQISTTSSTALQNASADGFRPTAASRGAIRAGAAPIGSGQIANPSARQWRDLANETAQRRGLPQQRPGLFTRMARGFKGLFSRSQ